MDKESMEMFQKILDRLDRMDGRFDIIEMKQGLTAKKLDDLQLDFKIFQRNTKRDFHKLNDEMETVIEILRANELIPN